MIANACVLDPEWVPSEIVHRNAEKNTLRDALQPVTEGREPQDCLITGPPGAGKTCLARYTVSQLAEEAIDIETQYVDCWMDSNRFQVLYSLLQGIGKAGTVHRSTPQDELLHRLREHDRPYIVILDEIDQLEDRDLLRELYSIDSITMCCLGNDADEILAPLDRRVRSRLQTAVQIRFDRYDRSTLLDILSARRDAGLDMGVLSWDQIEEIVDVAAGNARDAIAILRNAARAAQNDRAYEITDAHIENAIPEARAERRQKSLEKLNDHQRIIYELLLEHDGIAPKDIRAKYRDEVSDSKSDRTIRSYLKKLERYNLAEATGQGPSRRYYGLKPRS